MRHFYCVILLKGNVSICGAISINQAGKLTTETTCPKLFFQLLLAPGKRVNAGVKPCPRVCVYISV